MIRDFRKNIMAPIGRPENITGINPIFRRLEPIVPPGPTIRPPRPRPGPQQRQNFVPIGGLAGINKPPSIGGVGGTDIEDRLSIAKRPLLPPPLEDFGFGTGIRRSEDFMSINNRSGMVRPPLGTQQGQPLQKMPIEQRPNDFMSIGGPGGGLMNMGLVPQEMSTTPNRDLVRPPVPTTPNTDQQSGLQAIFNKALSTQRGETPTRPEDVVTNIENKGPNTFDPPVPITEPAPTTPAAVASDVGAVPDATMGMGAIDPVLLQQSTAETLTDPLIRSLYFGTQDSPGFFQQLQQAGTNLIGQDVPLQQTAGLTPLELLARQQAVAGIGGFEPFLQQNRDLVNQAIEQSRRAEQLQDPYYTQAEQIYKDTMGAYDPSMTQQFFNPFEDAVVQQTIDDVLEAGEQQDIAARSREIGAGAFGGSRARLGAMERREALGEGLAQALGRIRQQGFSEAQRTGLGEFAREQQAKRTGAEGLIGIGTGRGRAASNLAQNLAGLGGELTGLGQTQEQLRSGQRRELSGFGATERGIAETGLGRRFEQEMGQQLRPLGVLGQIGSMLPGYQQTRTQIDSQYGMPTDPTAAGLGAAFTAYGALAPRQGSS